MSVCLSVCLSACVLAYLSIYLSIPLSLCLSIDLSIHLSICRPTYLSINLSIYLSIHVYTYIYIWIYIYIYIYPSVRPSIHPTPSCKCGNHVLQAACYELNRAAAGLAKQAVAEARSWVRSRSSIPLSVHAFQISGGIRGRHLGPIGVVLPPAGKPASPKLQGLRMQMPVHPYEVLGLVEGGAHLHLLDMVSDTLNAEATGCSSSTGSSAFLPGRCLCHRGVLLHEP